MYPSFGLNCMSNLGVEEAQNWLDKPSGERNLTERSKGLVTLLCTPERTLEGKVWPEGLCSREGDTSLCWVCRYFGMPRWIDLV